MTKATVVFSDGSKRLAHNNEDLFERWQLRVEQETQNPRLPFGTIDNTVRQFVPDYPTPTSVQQCREWRVDVIEKERILVREMTLIKQAAKGSAGWKSRTAARRELLTEAADECRSQLRKLKLWLMANSPNETDNIMAELGMKHETERGRADYWHARAMAAEAELTALKSELGVA